MSRLPTVGSDDNTWGNVLNDFLGVEHNADGTQKTLPITKGGTGATDAATARSNIGAIARLQDASDVSVTSPAQGDTLSYDTSSGKFKNANGGYEPVFLVGSGAYPDFMDALNAAVAANGGIVQLPKGITRPSGDPHIVIPQTAGVNPGPITIRGVGGNAGYQDVVAGTGGSVLDLRYAGTGVAKIETYGIGLLQFEDLTLTDLGTSSLAFVFTAGTTLKTKGAVRVIGNPSKSGTACDQDGFLLGGGTTAVTNNGPTCAFQGYGTVIEGVYFDRIQRMVYGRTYCNDVVVAYNYCTGRCGSSGLGPIEFDGSGGSAVGNKVIGNGLELTNYLYGIIHFASQANYCAGNVFWDPGAGLVAAHYIAGAYSQSGGAQIYDVFENIAHDRQIVVATTSGTAGYSRFSPVANQRTTINGTTAGTAVCSQPVQTEAYKKVLVSLNGYENASGAAQTYTFPMLFAGTPAVTSQPAGFGATASTTALTLPTSMGAPVTGWLVAEGY